ncbi:MAG: CHASE2 domain-containing protein [Rhodocyclaceae bacterium]|nr:CHASE2 domain-containing protein [Rhodocyclaceae bacterium]
MKHLCVALCVGLAAAIPIPITAAAPSPFALVMIDDASAAKYGGFPVDRAVTAQAINKLAAAGVRGVVLKFFYDAPSNTASDVALASAMSKTKVILQARIDDSEAKPNRLPDRFALTVPAGPVAVSGVSAWLPLPVLSNRAHRVGFVDITSPDRVPAFERLGDHSYPSLTVAAISLALGDPALNIEPGKHLQLGGKTISLDAKSQIKLSANAFRGAHDTAYFSFADVVEGKTSLSALSGTVVVIGYHGNQMPTIRTNAGAIKLHLAFWLGLNDVWKQIQ